MELFLIVVLGIWVGVVISRLRRRTETLEGRLDALSRAVDATIAPLVAAASTATVSEVKASEPRVQAFEPPVKASEPPMPVLEREPEYAAESARGESDLERVIAGSWLNRIGILALLIATAFFLKFAFDNNWIGPVARIAIGLAAGAGLLAYSQSLFKKGFAFFSEGMVALGGGVLYLSLFAGWNFYHLIPVPLAFIGMVVVTAVILRLALARDSQRLALLALIGGFITPLLLNTGTDNEIGLFSYLAILNAGLLWASHARDWRSLPVAFIFTLVYAFAWYAQYYQPSKFVPSAIFATVFYVEFGLLPAINARRFGTLPQAQLPLVLFNATWFTFVLAAELSNHRFALAAWMLSLAAAHFIVARLAAAHEPPLARSIYGALAVTFVALAIAFGLRGEWVTIGWAVQGAALVLAGLRGRNLVLRMEGLSLFMLVVVRMSLTPFEQGHVLFNAQFATFVVVIACIGIASYRAYHQRDVLHADELVLYKGAGAAANGLAIWALSRELWNLDLAWTARDFALTILWSAYAGVVMMLGIARRSALVMWQSAALLALAVMLQSSASLGAAFQGSGTAAAVLGQARWLAMLWAFEGALFVWSGIHWKAQLARVTGQLIFIPAAFWLFAGEIPGGLFVLNPRFGTFAFVLACLAIAVAAARTERDALSSSENGAYNAMEVGINFLALWALSLEVWGIKSLAQEPTQLALTLLWTIYAAVLMLLGLRRGSALMRWEGLSLLAVVIGKVFILDLSVLPLGLRILSFLVLGIVLMAVSFFYQRRVRANRSQKP